MGQRRTLGMLVGGGEDDGWGHRDCDWDRRAVNHGAEDKAFAQPSWARLERGGVAQ